MIGVGRLKPGVSRAQAQDELARVSEGLVRENPDFNTGWSVNVQPMHADLVRDLRPALMVLLLAVATVLLIACVNVANLLLARAVAREREIALRAALGAGTLRLMRQLLAESLVIASLGGALGLGLAAAALRVVLAILPPEIPVVMDVSLSRRAVLLTVGAVLASALLSGLVPGLQLARPALVPALKEGGAVRSQGPGRRRLRSALVVGEVSLSIVLLAGASLLLRSFWKLGSVDPGFRAERVLTAQASLGARYEEPRRQVAFFEQATARLAALPGVESAGAISWMPFGAGSATSFRILERPAPPPGQEPGGDVRIVTPGTFRTLGVPVLRGRDFEPSDDAAGRKVVIVNEAMAREHWPDGDALGKRIGMSWGGEPEGEIVGVVGNVRLSSLDTPARATTYWPQAQVPNSFMTLLVKTTERPESVAAAVRKEVAAIDPELPLSKLLPLEQVAADSLASRRFLLTLVGVFASIALTLAMAGIYGVMSYSVAQRRGEVGVRVALGAQRKHLLRLVIGEGLALAAAGVGIGLAGASALTRTLRTLLFEVSPWDPAALAAVAALVLAVAVLATAAPARRAARVDPVSALRGE
jgi:putative ABC transport system permease protein